MANYNNPNMQMGMMHQGGYMNNPGQLGQQQQPHNPNYGNMNQMNVGPVNPAVSGGMQYQMQQQGMQGMGPGMSNPGMMGHQASVQPPMQQQQQPMQTGPMGSSIPSGPRPPVPPISAPSMTPTVPVSTENQSQHGGQLAQQTPAPQQQQQQQQQPQPNQPAQSKELNAASLCRFGQEAVQEIVSRAQEVFQTLRQTQPPDGKQISPAMDRKPKFQETLKHIKALFKRLRVIYDKMEESCPSKDDSYFEDSLPFKDSKEVGILDERKNTEAYKLAVEEYREVMEQLMLRNRQMKETVELLRQIIWDINTMLAMRKE